MPTTLRILSQITDHAAKTHYVYGIDNQGYYGWYKLEPCESPDITDDTEEESN